MMTPAVHSQKGAQRVVVGMLACVIVLLTMAGVRSYIKDRDNADDRANDRAAADTQRVKDREQIGALGDTVNVLVGQVDRLGGVPVVESAQEVNPSAPPAPLPGRDGRDGTSPPCLSTPTQCQGADGATPADGVDGAKGDPGINGQDSTVPGQDGQDSTVPGPEGPPCPTGTTGGFRPAPLPSTETYWLCVVDPP